MMTNLLRRAAAVGVVLSCAAAAAAQHQADPLRQPMNGPGRIEPGSHVLTHATVHVNPETTIEDASVYIRDGRIVAVTGADTGAGGGEAPDGFVGREWDCTGLHVYAGLIEPSLDVDSPTPAPEIAGAHWNPLVTPQRRAMDGPGVPNNIAEGLRKAGFVAAGVTPRGGIFRGQGAVVALADAPGELSERRPRVYAEDGWQGVAFQRARGRDTYPDSLMGAIALIRQTLYDAAWLDWCEEAGEAIGTPNALDPLRGGEDSGPTLYFEVSDELDALRAIKIGEEFYLPVMIRGSGTEFRRLDAIREKAAAGFDRYVLPVNFPEAPDVSSIGAAESVGLGELMTWEQAPTNPRRLKEAGCTVSLTTATLRDRSKFAEKVRDAMEIGGLGAPDALAMVTTNPARLLGVEDVLGTVEAGKAASLLVCDGPLFEKKTKVRDVWVDGERYEITAPPAAELEGEWVVTTDPPMAEETLLVFNKDNKVTVRQAKPGAADEAPDAKPEFVEAKGGEVKLSSDGRLSFVFDHAPFGEAGVMTVSALVGRGEAGGAAAPQGRKAESMRGQAVSPGGTVVPFTAQKRPAAEKADDEPTDDAAEGEEEGDEADVEQPEGARGRGGRGAGAGAVGRDEKPDPPPEELPGYPFGPYALKALPEQPIVIVRGATLWTCGEKGVIENGGLVFGEGRITFAGSGPELERFLSTVRFRSEPVEIDGAGLHVTPGIIDCHSHTGISGGVNEAGQSVTAEVRIGDVTDPDAISWYRQLAGGVTAVNNLHGSANPMGGQNQVNKNRWGAIYPDDLHFEGAISGIKFALGENVKQSNWGNEFRTRYPQTRMGVETLMRDRFTEARRYEAAWSNWHVTRQGPVLRRDLELEALAEILTGDRLVHCHSYRQDEILMLARLAEEFGFKIGTYQHILEGYKVAEFVRDFSGGGSSFSDWWAYKVEVQDAVPHNGTLMRDVGVVVSFNSDSDELARRMNVEAAKAVKYGGTPPEEALKFVTLNPAKQLRIDEHVGSLEAGKDADIAIWNGDPLSSYSKCVSTWVDGRELFSTEKDLAMREQNRHTRTRIIQKILKTKAPKAPAPKPAKPAEEPPDEQITPENPPGDQPPPQGRRGVVNMAQRGADAALRARYLDMVQRGLDPAEARCGVCGGDH